MLWLRLRVRLSSSPFDVLLLKLLVREVVTKFLFFCDTIGHVPLFFRYFFGFYGFQIRIRSVV